MIKMLEAVYSQYSDEDASADLRGLVTAFHFGQAASVQGLPIVVYNIIAGSTDYTIDNAQMDSYTLQFSIFAKTYIATMTIYDAVNTAYQNQALSYTSGSPLVCRREAMTGPEQLDDAYQVTTDFLITTHLD